jgi:ABC-2 type transport system ATP-binding protein
MGAARYIGRVGGLAVALGVGTAIVTGQGVASATTGSDDKSTTEAPSTTNGSDPGTSTDNGGVKIKKAPRLADILGKHHADATTAGSSLATSIVDRLTQKPTKKTQLPSLQDRIAAHKSDNGTQTDTDPVNNDVSNDVITSQVVVDKPAVKPHVLDWLSSPSVVAGRTEKPTKPLSSLWTPPSAQSIAPLQAPQRISSLITTVVGDVLSPFAGNSPLAPPVDSPLSWVMLAASRKEFSTDTITTQSLVSPTLVTTPYDIGVVQGVVTGCTVHLCSTTSNGLPLTYTVVGDPTNGGKVAVDPTTGKFTFLPFADQTANDPSGTESFKVLVAQTTQLDTFLTGIPLVGTAVFVPVINTLQQVPIVSVVLAPLIGSAYVQQIDANSDDLTDEGTIPIAYTTKVTSWDGTLISTNFFPAIITGTPPEDGSPTILNGPGLASPGATDPTDPFVSAFRSSGYNVVTWDPRGEFDSGGVLQLDSPQFEGQDVSQLITWVATKPGVLDDKAPTATTPGDPRVGMVGVSYGGGIQLVTAANDPRIDAIAPGWSWNTLPASLYPDDAFKTAYSSLLLLGLVTTGATINTQIYGGILTGALLGVLTPSQIALLQNSGPGFTVGNITAPTLLISGTVDVLFPLEQSLVNAGLLSEPQFTGDPTAITKVIWFCGGHGSCLPGQGDPATDAAWTLEESLEWMNTYVAQDSTTPPEDVFEWADQNGDHWGLDTIPPADPTKDINGFYGTPIATHSTTGGFIPIIPIIGGSGPQTQVALPYSLGDGAPAALAVNVPLNNPTPTATNPDGTTYVVGTPTVTMTYSGIGTSSHVYAQIVDKKTGLVVGNLVTPIPVTLNGQTQQVTVQLNDVAYTMDDTSDLELQIVGTATPFLNLTEFGYINVSDVTVDLPTTSQTPTQLDPVLA